MVDFSLEISKTMIFGQINPNDVFTAEDEQKLKNKKAKEELRKRKEEHINYEIQLQRERMVDEAQAYEQIKRLQQNQRHFRGQTKARGNHVRSIGRGRGRARASSFVQDDGVVPLSVRQERVHRGITQLTPDGESLHSNNIQRAIWQGDTPDEELSLSDLGRVLEKYDTASGSDSSRSTDQYEDASASVYTPADTSLRSSPFSCGSSPCLLEKQDVPATLPCAPAARDQFPALPSPGKPIRRSRIAAIFPNMRLEDEPTSETEHRNQNGTSLPLASNSSNTMNHPAYPSYNHPSGSKLLKPQDITKGNYFLKDEGFVLKEDEFPAL